MAYLLDEVKDFFKEKNEILFIPYARPGGISFDEYTEAPRKAFAPIGISVKGIHEFENPIEAIKNAKGIFTGGGNTFLLLKTLYDNGLMETLREVVQNGTPYMGSSAGSNITGLTIGTSNDMPIVYPPSFNALQWVPFNINPHYLDPDPNSKHQGETREQRINEFHFQNSQPVVGLREGSWLRVENNTMHLKGSLKARIFEPGKEAEEVAPGDLSYLLNR
jgi:dipeptidase E